MQDAIPTQGTETLPSKATMAPPPPPCPGEPIDWWTVEAWVTANFEATGRWDWPPGWVEAIFPPAPIEPPPPPAPGEPIDWWTVGAWVLDHHEATGRWEWPPGWEAVVSPEVPAPEPAPRETAVFYGYTVEHGWEPWAFDGTTAWMLADVNPGQGNSHQRYDSIPPMVPVDADTRYAITSTYSFSNLSHVFESFDGSLFFPAFHPDTGTELYRVDAGTGNAELVADINPGTLGTHNLSGSFPGRFAVLDETLYFSAYHPDTGFELYRMGSATGEIELAADINPGSEGSYLSEPIALGGFLYFRAFRSDTGWEMFRLDGTTGEVSLAADIRPGPEHSFPQELTAFGDDLYFIAQHDSQEKTALYRLEGETGEIGIVDLNGKYSSIFGLTALDGELYFHGDDLPAERREFLRLDAGSGEVSVVVGADSNLYVGSEVTKFEGELYFAAGTPDSSTGSLVVNNYELFRLNGRSGEVELVADVNPGPEASMPTGFTVFGRSMYFSASRPDTGSELFRLDAETDSVSIFTDRIEGPLSSNMRPVGVVNNVLALTWRDPDLYEYRGDPPALRLASYDGDSLIDYNVTAVSNFTVTDLDLQIG